MLLLVVREPRRLSGCADHNDSERRLVNVSPDVFVDDQELVQLTRRGLAAVFISGASFYGIHWPDTFHMRREKGNMAALGWAL